ncbi:MULTISPECIES: hypothetical protein [Halolamina]|uniref:Uncharacterized protein n=1 Tax=Halolamina pelagica TaxID=699431 RepID=A0A1I5SWR1_9EURY|nr:MULTISPECIES: hypothetical protein [Halolamina]NHX36894.1 hypothetical protein [Halolamina sp. R1-12]SFP75190.1 hypothetical protein SAMN05216277_10750 [Halolamina pelagica]
MPLQDRFERWHLLLFAAFLVGAGGSLSGATAIHVPALLAAVLSGLLWAFAVYVFVATFRNYVASYAETGGSLWSPRFLAPFAVGAVAAVGIYVWEPIERASTGALVADALTVGFWAFVLTMVLSLTGSYVVAGYREGAQ